MAHTPHLDVLKQGVEAWNRWRIRYEVHPDLSSVRISEWIGSGATADLREANFYRTNFRDSSLHGVDLTGAKLEDADLHGADLREAKLSGASLVKTNLSSVKLQNTDFADSEMWETVLAGVDLRLATGLETVHHWGPSYISVETIYRSGGKIPEIFLRGAGVPENFVTYMKSLAGKAIEFYSCFISYSTKDQEFAELLYADLQANGVRCWFAPHDMAGGKKIHEQIDEAIRLHDKLLVILSPDSIKSAWVETEIAKARKREVRNERRVLFPVRLVGLETLRGWECFDADTGKDSAREIREYFIPDFSDWKNHDSYQQGFQKLLKDLKAGE